MKAYKRTYRLIALLLASNYFAFQVELFENEYEENHPKVSDVPTIACPSLNWETFDKDNAAKAFTIDPEFRVEQIFSLPSPTATLFPPYNPLFVIRDKSPPALPS